MLINHVYNKQWHNQRIFPEPVRKNYFLHRASEFGRDTTEVVRSRIEAANTKNSKLRKLVVNRTPISIGTQPKANISRRSVATVSSNKARNFRSLESKKNPNRIAARLLKERVEPPVNAFGLPNFAMQTEVLEVDTRTTYLDHLFSHVNLFRFKLENISAIAHKILLFVYIYTAGQKNHPGPQNE